MKKTKLLTSLAALALVLGLGACEEPVEEETSEDTDVTTETGDTTETDDDDGDGGNTGDTGEGGDTGAGSGGEEGGNEDNPVANLLSDIKQNNNFTLTLEYYDWYSDYYEDESTMLADYYGGSMTVNGHDYFIDMTYTEDAVLLQYYTSYTEWYYSSVYDVELYVNNYTTGTLDPYYVNWSNNPVDYTDLVYSSDYVTTGTWQSNFNTLLGLVDYGDHFIKGDSSYNFWYGTMYDYTVNIDSASFLNRLCTYLLDGGNWFYDYSYFASDASSFYSSLGAPDQSATYYEDYGEFDLSLDYFVESKYQSGSSSTGYEYQLVYDSIYAGLYDVGTSSIPSTYSQYLS